MFCRAPKEWIGPEFSIRQYESADAQALARAVMDSFDHLQSTMPWAKSVISGVEAETTIEQMLAGYSDASDFPFGIWIEDRLVGGTGFHFRWRHSPWPAGAPKIAEIGMWIHGDEAGKGLGTRVLLAMIDWAFTEWDFDRLIWRCNADNWASMRVAQKAGLQREGCLRQDAMKVNGEWVDTLLFATLRTDWAKDRS